MLLTRYVKLIFKGTSKNPNLVILPASQPLTSPTSEGLVAWRKKPRHHERLSVSETSVVIQLNNFFIERYIKKPGLPRPFRARNDDSSTRQQRPAYTKVLKVFRAVLILFMISSAQAIMESEKWEDFRGAVNAAVTAGTQAACPDLSKTCPVLSKSTKSLSIAREDQDAAMLEKLEKTKDLVILIGNLFKREVYPTLSQPGEDLLYDLSTQRLQNNLQNQDFSRKREEVESQIINDFVSSHLENNPDFRSVLEAWKTVLAHEAPSAVEFFSAMSLNDLIPFVVPATRATLLLRHAEEIRAVFTSDALENLETVGVRAITKYKDALNNAFLVICSLLDWHYHVGGESVPKLETLREFKGLAAPLLTPSIKMLLDSAVSSVLLISAPIDAGCFQKVTEEVRRELFNSKDSEQTQALTNFYIGLKGENFRIVLEDLSTILSHFFFVQSLGESFETQRLYSQDRKLDKTCLDILKLMIEQEKALIFSKVYSLFPR